MRINAAFLQRAVALTVLATSVQTAAWAVPPPPPPPAVLARMAADCRVPPAETIPLTRAIAPLPQAQGLLKPDWAIKVTPPSGAHIGRVIGLTSTWNGSILAATDRGYWLRVPSVTDEALAAQAGPVAATIRDVPGQVWQMGFAGWSGEPGYVGLNVWLAVKGEPRLLAYEIGGCFPGARPLEPVRQPSADGLVRLLPATGGSRLLHKEANGRWTRLRASFGVSDRTSIDGSSSPLMSSASVVASIPLAGGCDELVFQRQGQESHILTQCSPGFADEEKTVQARPQHRHRQPRETTGLRDIGTIEAPIVAISDVRFHVSGTPMPVRRGDRNDPGQPCSFLLAAQPEADAPVTIYGLQPYCAYWPRDPSDAPLPLPPP
jgi:hypothetical protein